ncbi:MAG: YtxH domain-containing protein [Thermomicrobiales bacterium]
MIGRARTALKFFVYGLVAGLFFAPRSGEETRSQVFAWANRTVKDVVGNVSGGNVSVGNDA